MSGPAPTYLAFDFGTRRIGVAVGQAITGTASPLAELPARDGTPSWEEVEGLLAAWRPAALVVGLPLDAQGRETPLARRARRFGNRLRGRYNLPVYFVDERLSSREAEARGGGRKVDALAAAVILETWLGRRRERDEP